MQVYPFNYVLYKHILTIFIGMYIYNTYLHRCTYILFSRCFDRRPAGSGRRTSTQPLSKTPLPALVVGVSSFFYPIIPISTLSPYFDILTPRTPASLIPSYFCYYISISSYTEKRGRNFIVWE